MISFKRYLTELHKVNIDAIKSKLVSAMADTEDNSSSAYMRTFRIRTGKDVSDLMSRYNFQKLGKGAYAVVYENKTYPYVIKIWDIKDKGYETWLDFVLNNQNNPYVPKVRGKPTIIKGTGHKFIRLEKLYPAQDGDWDRIYNDLEKPDNQHLKDIAKILNANRYMYDVTDGNIMRRPNGQLVLTDPLAP